MSSRFLHLFLTLLPRVTISMTSLKLYSHQCSDGGMLDDISGGEGDIPLLPKFPNGKAMGPQYEGQAELEIIRDIGYGRYGQVGYRFDFKLFLDIFENPVVN